MVPPGFWTDGLSDRQKDYVENLLSIFGLRRLDTRDRDMARHAIYHALLFGPVSGQAQIDHADRRVRHGEGWHDLLCEDQRRYADDLIEEFDLQDIDEPERARQGIWHALMFGPRAPSMPEGTIADVAIPNATWGSLLSAEQRTYVQDTVDRLIPHASDAAGRDILQHAIMHALLFGPRARTPVVGAATES